MSDNFTCCHTERGDHKKKKRREKGGGGGRGESEDGGRGEGRKVNERCNTATSC